MLRRLLCLALLAAVAPCQRLDATATRFELGNRLRLLERALERHDSPAARKALAPILSKGVQAFFAGRMKDLGKLLARSRTVVATGKEPTVDELAALSVAVRPPVRWVHGDELFAKCDLLPMWGIDTLPEGLRIEIESEIGTSTASIDDLPEQFDLAIPQKDGDHELTVTLALGKRTLREEVVLVSRTVQRNERFAAIDEAVKALPREPMSSLVETARWQFSLLRKLRTGRSLETVHPAHHMLESVEGMVRAHRAGEPWFGRKNPGDHFVRLATEGGLVTARLMVPEAAANQDGKLPLVIALHGAGGTENLFFDGYGDGLGPKMAEEKGWLFLAPRTSTKPQAVIDSIAELDRMYGVDRERVYLMGHSMGAAATAKIHQLHPKVFRALALLGGAGGVQKPEAFRLPVFVGVGDQDLLGRGARNFAKRLERAGIESVTYRLYEDVEHMAIVQLALPDVFEFFEK